jgi:ADP-ribose pyrophosphatase YjhB (NUDIX family)
MPMSEYMRGLREKVGTMLLEIPTASVLTFDEHDRVLLVKHADVHRWTTAGGAVEPKERPADAAVREMWEETGLHVALTRIIGVFGGPEFSTTYSNGDAVSFLTTVFEGRRVSGEPRPDGVETSEVRWVAQADLGLLETAPWVLHVLSHAFRDRSRPHFDPPTWAPTDP